MGKIEERGESDSVWGGKGIADYARSGRNRVGDICLTEPTRG